MVKKTNKKSTVSVEGSMFLYDKPEYLSHRMHGNLGWRTPSDQYAFAKTVSSIPLVASEIPTAQKFYPIVFPDVERGGPIAVFSSNEGSNPFIDKDGKWEKDIYIPAYLRRYPIATVQGEADRVAIVVDRASNGIVEDPEFKFFENDKLTDWAQRLVDFSVKYERDQVETNLFMDKIREFELLTTKHVGQKIEGKDQAFANFISIDESRLRSLSDEQILELNSRGYLAIIFGQLFSQENWGRIISKNTPVR